MKRYKDTVAEGINETEELDALYAIVSERLEISLVEAQALVDEYITGEVDKDDLLDEVDNEVAWLDVNIPLVATADLATLRAYLERTMKENRRMLKAWKFVIKNVEI